MGELFRRMLQAYGVEPSQDDKSIWEEEPVSPEEFFKTFIREPFFPAQQEFVDAMMGKSPLDWDTLYTEGIALWGNG